MGSKHPHAVSLELTWPDEVSTPAVTLRPPPLLHHPLIGISIALVVASIAQIGVWAVNTRLIEAPSLVPVRTDPSSLVASEVLFELLTEAAGHLATPKWPDQRLVFSACLLLSMASVVAWYIVARLTLGAAWGMWIALLWGIHPLYAWLAQRPNALALSICAVPFAWTLLLWWGRSRRRRVAFIAGIGVGLASCATPIAVAALLLPLPLLSLVNRRRGRWLSGFGALLIGVALPITVAGFLISSERIKPPWPTFSSDLFDALDTADGSAIARAARLQLAGASQEPSLRAHELLWRQARLDPAGTGIWLARRFRQSIYATADGTLERSILALQVAILLPGLWGVWTGLHRADWRWATAASLVLLISFWLMCAVAEPRVRSLAPVSGVFVMFTLMGIADIYQRLFGHSLVRKTP